MPQEILDKEMPQAYLVFPVHYKNKCYGYMAMVFEGEDWPGSYVQAYLMGLANAIEEAEVHKQIADLENIRILYHKDALTGIYNRRGFEKHLRSHCPGIRKLLNILPGQYSH